MLKKTLIATAAISATLLAAVTVLPALAQSRSAASANAAAPGAPVDAASQDKLSAANDTGTRKAEGSGHGARHGDEGRRSSVSKDKEKEKHKSRD
jgi:hypothetical protein